MTIESLVTLTLGVVFLVGLALYMDSHRAEARSPNRKILKQCAEKLGVTETTAVHIAINRLYMQLFPEKIAEEAPTDEQIAEANDRNAPTDKDPVVHTTSLTDLIGR